MEKELSTILENYRDFYSNPKVSYGDEFKKNIRYNLPSKIHQLLDGHYKIVGSYGMGNLTETPWISIFDREITEGAQRGFYLVFLFRKDMSGVYLSLNQGTTYLNEKFKGNRPRKQMKNVAKLINEKIAIPTIKFPELHIDLKSNTSNALNYEAANICAKFYRRDNIPKLESLVGDVKILLNTLNELKSLIGIRTLDEFVDDLLFQEQINDVKFQEDIQIAKPSKTTEEPKSVSEKNEKNYSGWKRDASIAKEAIIKANYLCEIDNSHNTFISAITNKNFVEAHHLLPMNHQGDFSYSLDVPGNIVALCPNCHREIHHAKAGRKKNLLKSLYDIRKASLEKYGLYFDLAKLLKTYGIEK